MKIEEERPRTKSFRCARLTFRPTNRDREVRAEALNAPVCRCDRSKSSLFEGAKKGRPFRKLLKILIEATLLNDPKSQFHPLISEFCKNKVLLKVLRCRCAAPLCDTVEVNSWIG